MTMVSKTALGIAAGICGTVFIGYCLYFDKKRREDPNFKKKLKERRRAAKIAAVYPMSIKNSLPDLKDPEAVQKFFIKEVQIGEESLGRGEITEAVDHLCNAIAVCGQPNNLLQVLQQTIPPDVFQMILIRLPSIGQSIMKHQEAAFSGPSLDPE